MSPIDIIVIVMISFLAGTIGATVGLGGGFLIVPMLVLVFGLQAQLAAGTSLLAVVFTAVSGTLGYAWQRRIDYRLGPILASASLPGAILGAFATTWISSKLLSVLFGLFLVIVSAYMVILPETEATPGAEGEWTRRIVDRDGVEFRFAIRHMAVGVGSGFFSGFLSGFFGVGGGALQVPVMTLLLGVPVHIAVATSALIILLTSLGGAATHIGIGNVAAQFAYYIIPSVVVGAQAGVQIQRRTRPRTLRRLFALFLAVIGLRMIAILLLG